MIVATFVKQLGGTWKGDARLYRLSEPVVYGHDQDCPTTDHVIISAVSVFGRPETYIFPSDADGNALQMLEMDGSYPGTLSHEVAIQEAGWELEAVSK